MISLPIWVIFAASIIISLVSFICGVIACYRGTPRIGDIITARDQDTKDLYLFLELDKPLEQTVGEIKDGKEVLATFRVKNNQ